MTTKIKSGGLNNNIITTSHLHTNFSVDSDKIAANAIGPSELNQAANFTFTGTVTGAGDPAKILQIVHATPINPTSGSTSGSSSYATYITKSITPSSASNKILILSKMNAYTSTGTTWSGSDWRARLLRGSTEIVNNNMSYSRRNVHATAFHGGDLIINHIDSPNTTSEVTYNYQAKYNSPSNSMSIYHTEMILMEVVA